MANRAMEVNAREMMIMMMAVREMAAGTSAAATMTVVAVASQGIGIVSGTTTITTTGIVTHVQSKAMRNITMVGGPVF